MSLPDVHFGSAEEEVPVDEIEEDDTPDDDEELKVTPPDVIAVLGFDPLDEDFEDD